MKVKEQVSFMNITKQTENWLAIRAQNLLILYKLHHEWTFEFSNTVRLGDCNYITRTIRVSRKYFHLPLKDLEQTLLHELAHALTPNEQTSHGPRWREVAAKIGVKEPTAIAKNIKKAEGKWNLHCKNCNTITRKGRHRRTNVSNRYHPACGAELGILEWRER